MSPIEPKELRALLEEAQAAVAIAATQNVAWVGLWQRIEDTLVLLREPPAEGRDV